MPRARQNPFTSNIKDFIAIRLLAAGSRRSARLAQREWPRMTTSARTFYRRLAAEVLKMLGPR